MVVESWRHRRSEHECEGEACDRSWHENLFDVAVYGQATCVLSVVPAKVHDGEFGAFLVFSDGVMLLEDRATVEGMALANVLNAEVVNDQGE